MAYYLDNPSNNAARIETTSAVSVGNNVGDYVEFSGFANTGNANGFYRIIGETSGFNNLIELTSTGVNLRADATDRNDEKTFVSGYTQPSVGTDFIIRLERYSAGWECFLDGVSLGQVSGTETLTFDAFFDFNSRTVESFLGACYYIEASTNGGVSVTNYWDSSASSGTGSTLPDTVGANDGTLVNFPTDDSQWVFYDAGGAVTGTGSPQAQAATVSGTGERVVSGSGTPQAATATTSGTGSTAGNIAGSGAVTAQRATSTGIGLRVITGTGSPTAQAATTTGTGSVSGAVSGTGSVNAQPATASGAGMRIVTGSGTAQATGATVSGTGQVAGAVSGTGAVQAQRATATGVGLRVITGQGTGQAQRATASGTGSVQGAITGTGTAQAQRATATGVGLRVITGTGSVQAQRATAEGSDRGFLPRPVVKPGSIDIAPKYGTTDIQPKYGTTDY